MEKTWEEDISNCLAEIRETGSIISDEDECVTKILKTLWTIAYVKGFDDFEQKGVQVFS